MTKTLEKQLNSLPKFSGIYKFLNKKGTILYVGKAKNLKSRVKSYFIKQDELSGAKQDMIKQIYKIETILTKNETEALVLESMQIKKYKPKYNITFKDDKDYNFVKIDFTQKYPTITTIRRPKIQESQTKSGSIKYYGPFTSSYALNENLRFLRRIFPFRKKTSRPTKFENDLLQKRSIGPVPKTQKEYLDMIKKCAKVINGKTSTVKKELKRKMQKLSKEKKYEQAVKVRDQIKWLDIFTTRQKIVSTKEYLELSMPLYNKIDNALEDLKNALKLKNIPHRIEGYDISNIQGQFSVGSMVVFTDAKPDKNEYRKFKIKTIKGSDDFKSLAEVLKRRFNHTEWTMPDLVLLDGGKGQLSVIIKELFNNKNGTTHDLRITTPQFISIAKKYEQIFHLPSIALAKGGGNNAHPVKLDPKSQASYLLQRIRDEAHRFAQKYYHTLHSKSYENKSRKKRTKKAQSAQNES